MVRQKALCLALLVGLLIAPGAWADGLDLARQGLAAQRAGDFDKAIGLYTEAIEKGGLTPADLAVTLTNRGDSRRSKGDVAKAVADYRAAIKAAPDVFSGYNSLAWVLATNPKAEFRDGKEALELAQKAVELCDPLLLPACLDTLAAAHAETGNYREAVKQQKKAVGLLKKQGAANMVAELNKRLKTYKKNKPWRDTAAP